MNNSLARFDGLKTDIDVGYDETSLDIVRFAALTNDVFTFAMKPGKQMTMSVFPEPEKRKDIFGENFQISLATDRVRHLRGLDGEVQGHPSFVHPDHPDVKRVVDILAPLMLRGRALLRPHRTLLLSKPTPLDREKWEMLSIDEASPFDHWSSESLDSEGVTLPLRQSEAQDTKDHVKLFEIVLPYLSGVGFHDLAKILEDEQLHLAKARVAMQKVVKDANAGDLTRSQVINEVLRPELDDLERRFRRLASSKVLKQCAAGVGAATVTLVAYFTGGTLAAASSAAGAGGLGLLARDWLADKEKAEAYKDSPYYLFWRLKQLQR